MKRLMLLTVLAVSLMALLSWVNCSNPLEAEKDGPILIVENFDTVFRFDTTWVYDTVGNDTVVITDTLALDTVKITDTLEIEVEIEVFVTDTLEIIVTDTLEITVTDTLEIKVTDTLYVPVEGEITTICSPILANLYEIFWTFDNPAGDYQLDFAATIEMDHPHRYLILDIDGTEYTWHPSDSLNYTIEQYLSEGSTIHIRTDSPHMLGHWVDLCMTWIKK